MVQVYAGGGSSQELCKTGVLGEPEWRGLGQDVGLYRSLGCEMPVGLQWALRSLHGAQGTSLTGVGLDGPVQTLANIRVPTRAFHTLLAPRAWLPVSSSLQEVAAHQELSEHHALHLSTCLQNLLQEEMPGKGNEAMEKLAELPFAGTAMVKGPAGTPRVAHWATTTAVGRRRMKWEKALGACVVPTQPRKLGNESTASPGKVALRGWGSKRKSAAAFPEVVGSIPGCQWCFCFNLALCSHQGTFFLIFFFFFF